MNKILFVSLLVVLLGALTVANPTTEDENRRDQRAPKPKMCGGSPLVWLNKMLPYWKRCQPKQEPCPCEEGERCRFQPAGHKYYCQGQNTTYPKEPCDGSGFLDTERDYWKPCQQKTGCMCEKGEKCLQFEGLDEFYCQGPYITPGSCDDRDSPFNENLPKRKECRWNETCVCIKGDKCLQLAGSDKKFCQGKNTQWNPCDDKNTPLDVNNPYREPCTWDRDCTCKRKRDRCHRRNGTDEYYCQGTCEVSSNLINPRMPYWKRCQPKGACQCEEGELCLLQPEVNKYFCQGPNTKYPEEHCDGNEILDLEKPYWKPCKQKTGCMCEKGEKCLDADTSGEFFCQGPNTTFETCDDYHTTFNDSFPRRLQCSWNKTCECIPGDKCLKLADSDRKFCQGPHTQWKTCDNDTTLNENLPYWKRCTPGKDCVCVGAAGNQCHKRKDKNEYYCQGTETNNCERQTKKFKKDDYKEYRFTCRIGPKCECPTGTVCLESASTPGDYRCW